MMSKWAPIRGTSVIFSELKDDMVLLMKDGYNYFVTKLEVFDDLYIRLSYNRAALITDCIEYVVFYPEIPLALYPDWYIEGYDNGMIFEDDNGNFLFYDLDGDMAMAPGSIMMVNHLGQLRYNERYQFEKYYEPIGGI